MGCTPCKEDPNMVDNGGLRPITQKRIESLTSLSKDGERTRKPSHSDVSPDGTPQKYFVNKPDGKAKDADDDGTPAIQLVTEISSASLVQDQDAGTGTTHSPMPELKESVLSQVLKKSISKE